MMDSGNELETDESPDSPVDPRIHEMVEYAGSAVEIVLNATFLLDEWMTEYLQRTDPSYRQGFTVEQKFRLAVAESGALQDDEYGAREVFGFLGDLVRVRTGLARETEESVLDRMVDAYIRHGGTDAGEDAVDSWDRLGMMRRVVSGYLAYAQAWMTGAGDEVCDDRGEDLGSDVVEDPGWEPRVDGGSCNFTMAD